MRNEMVAKRGERLVKEHLLPRESNEEVLLGKRGMGKQKKRSGRKVLQPGPGKIQSDEPTKRGTHEA